MGDVCWVWIGIVDYIGLSKECLIPDEEQQQHGKGMQEGRNNVYICGRVVAATAFFFPLLAVCLMRRQWIFRRRLAEDKKSIALSDILSTSQKTVCTHVGGYQPYQAFHDGIRGFANVLGLHVRITSPSCKNPQLVFACLGHCLMPTWRLGTLQHFTAFDLVFIFAK